MDIQAPEHIEADKDHTPVVETEPDGETSVNCLKCGLAVTWDGQHHGFTE